MNSKTTIAGLLAALLPWLRGVVPADFAVIVDAAASLALAVLGYLAVDKTPAAGPPPSDVSARPH